MSCRCDGECLLLGLRVILDSTRRHECEHPSSPIRNPSPIMRAHTQSRPCWAAMILTGTLAFNLLMGRRWPPTAEELAEAKQLCDELGLGDLLSRMPSGLMQVVGETGWQLSHGERSRLYLARALLKKRPSWWFSTKVLRHWTRKRLPNVSDASCRGHLPSLSLPICRGLSIYRASDELRVTKALYS